MLPSHTVLEINVVAHLGPGFNVGHVGIWRHVCFPQKCKLALASYELLLDGALQMRFPFLVCCIFITVASQQAPSICKKRIHLFVT